LTFVLLETSSFGLIHSGSLYPPPANARFLSYSEFPILHTFLNPTDSFTLNIALACGYTRLACSLLGARRFSIWRFCMYIR